MRGDPSLGRPGPIRSRVSLRLAHGAQPGGGRVRVSVRRESIDDLHAHGQAQAAQMLELPSSEGILRRLAHAVG
jgi:hypothetical protein